MNFILNKLFSALLNAVSEIYVVLINAFITTQPIVELSKLNVLFECIRLIAVFIFFLSVMKDIFSKIINIDGSITDIKWGEYLVRIIGGLVIMLIVRDIIIYLSIKSMDLLLEYIDISKEVFEISSDLGFLEAVEVSIALVICLLISIIAGIMNVVSILKTKVEIFLMIIVSDLMVTDAYNSLDKLNSFISKFIGFHIAIGLKITILSLGMYVIKNSADGLDMIKNSVLATIIYIVGANPVGIVDLLTTPKSSGGSFGQGLKYGMGNKVVSSLSSKIASVFRK